MAEPDGMGTHHTSKLALEPISLHNNDRDTEIETSGSTTSEQPIPDAAYHALRCEALPLPSQRMHTSPQKMTPTDCHKSEAM